jgi:hypothetical protein
VLTAAFPGKMALRPLQQLLAEAFDEMRSIGWISELLSEIVQGGLGWGIWLKRYRIILYGMILCRIILYDKMT